METVGDSTAASDKTGVTRRGFYHRAIYVIGGVISAALAAPAAAYLLLGPKPRKDDTWVDFGDVGKLPVGQPIEMVGRRTRTDGWKVISEKVTAWVLKKPNDAVVAFGPQCTHLGCAHHWDDQKGRFVCPCHNSYFSIDGTVLSGPAPRPLDRYQVKVDGNKLLLGELSRKPEHLA